MTNPTQATPVANATPSAIAPDQIAKADAVAVKADPAAAKPEPAVAAKV
jgi:hypothetical protein